jgi:uncharacterized protein YjiS (DUF1127 family)
MRRQDGARILAASIGPSAPLPPETDAMIRHLVHAAARRRRAHATFHILAGLDAGLLDDIGLTADDVERLRPPRFALR